jgi:stage IV sporulation protein FB
MAWSIPIGTVQGTVIRLHLTFLLFLVYIGVMHWARGGPEAALEGVLFIVLLFACVLLHEFGHILAARRYGVQTPDVTLLPIGGVARLERIPEQPAQELVVALAGPAVNLVIAAALFLVLGGSPTPESMEVADPGPGLLARLASVNIFLAVFNLIPAFPMDGGRVLRALLAYRLGYARATQIAASVGQAAAFAFGLMGLLGGNVVLMFIALFVYLAAASEASAVQMREASRALLIDDAMVTRFESLSPDSRIEQAVQCLIRSTQHEFPVVDAERRLMGLLTRDELIRGLRERGPDATVSAFMRTDIPTVPHRRGLDEGLRQMQEKHLPAVGVVDGEGRLVGLLTPENIGELMMIQAALPDRSARLPWRRGTATPTV